VAAQPVDQLDHRRPLGCEHILDFLVLPGESIRAVDFVQFRQDRDQQPDTVLIGYGRQLAQRVLRRLQAGAIVGIKPRVILIPLWTPARNPE